MPRVASTLAMFVLLWSLPLLLNAAEDSDTDKAFFNEKILPVLKSHCFECHSRDAEEVKGQLKLDTREALRAGGQSGAIIVPSEPDRSLLMKVLKYDEDDRQMPPRGKLDEAIINDFSEWIKRGAVDPRDP